MNAGRTSLETSDVALLSCFFSFASIMAVVVDDDDDDIDAVIDAVKGCSSTSPRTGICIHVDNDEDTAC